MEWPTQFCCICDDYAQLYRAVYRRGICVHFNPTEKLWKYEIIRADYNLQNASMFDIVTRTRLRHSSLLVLCRVFNDWLIGLKRFLKCSLGRKCNTRRRLKLPITSKSTRSDVYTGFISTYVEIICYREPWRKWAKLYSESVLLYKVICSLTNEVKDFVYQTLTTILS